MVEEFTKEEMERLHLDSSEKETPQNSNRPDTSLTESKACPDLHKDLTDLTSQVQMMSDSLAACKQMSKYRPLRKAFDGAVGATTQTLPPAEKATQSSAWAKDLIVSYATSRTDHRWNASVSQESTPGDLDVWEGCTHDADALRLPSDVHKAPRTDDADALRLATLIQTQLQALVLLAPSVSLLAALLSDTILRYTGCRRCSKRISSSLPWILSRIQELIAYVAAKRKPIDSYGCHPVEPTAKEVEIPVQKEKSSESVAPPREEPPTEFGKSLAVNPSQAGDTPGVQILLQVKPEKQKKRFFEKAGQTPPEVQVNHCVVQLHESVCVPVVHLVNPRPVPRVLGQAKQAVSSPRQFSYGVCLVFRHYTRTPAVVVQLTPVAWAVAFRKAREAVNLNAVAPLEERTLQWKKNPVTVLTKKTSAPVQKKHEEKIPKVPSRDRGTSTPPTLKQKRGTRVSRGANERTYGLDRFLANAPPIVKELLKEAEEEKMERKKLEVEVNGVKDLMLEVHRNQIELSRFLLEKGIYSQPIIKLTNPHMLEEESAAVRQLEVFMAGNGSRSVESLQEEIGLLKERCTMKNQMIVSIVKGLQSNVPQEWWEEMMISAVDDSKPTEEIDYQKFTELYGNISFFITNDEQASRKTTLTEEQSSDEEPITKGKVGADIKEDLINLPFDGENTAKAKARRLPDWQSQGRIMAFPAYHVPQEVNTSILKLENQISLLNVENEKLWHEVHQLRDRLKGSVRDLNMRRQSTVASNERLPGKTINLTIQIATEKIPRSSSKNIRALKISEMDDTDSQDSFTPTAKSFPAVHFADPDALSEGKQLDSEDSRLTLLSSKPKFHLKSSRRHSRNDLNSLDDVSLTPEKSRTGFPQGVTQRVQQVMVMTPHPSGHNFANLQKPDGQRAGPSVKNVDFLLQKPSVMQLAEGQSPEVHTMTANERQLLPILENDNAGPSSSTSQTIQRLRTRVRSIHKEVTMLKLKNDRIEKLLDKLLDDAVYNNNKSLEEMEHSLNEFTNRLG